MESTKHARGGRCSRDPGGGASVAQPQMESRSRSEIFTPHASLLIGIWWWVSVPTPKPFRLAGGEKSRFVAVPVVGRK